MKRAAAALLALLPLGSAAWGQDARIDDLSRLFPAKVEIYFETRDLESFNKALGDTFGDEAVARFVASNNALKMSSSLASLIGGDEPARVAGCIHDAGPAAPDSPLPFSFQMLIAYDVGARKDVAKTMAEKAAEESKEKPTVTDVDGATLYRVAIPGKLPFDGFTFVQSGSLVLLGTVETAVQAALKRLSGKADAADKRLADDATFAEARRGCGSSQVLVAARFNGLLDALRPTLAQMFGLDPEDEKTGKAVDAYLAGISAQDIRWIAIGYRASAGQLCQDTFATGEKGCGMLGLHTEPEKRMGPPAFLPDDVQAFAMGTFDHARFRGLLDAAFTLLGGRGESPREQLQKMIGKDIVTDVMGQMRGPIVVYQQPAVRGARTTTLVAPVADPAVVRGFYDALVAMQGAFKRQETVERAFVVDARGARGNDMMLLDFSTLCVDGGRALATSGAPADLEKLVARLADNSRAAPAMKEYAELAKEIPERACFIQFSRGGGKRPWDDVLGAVGSSATGMAVRMAGVDLLSLGAGRVPWIEWAEPGERSRAWHLRVGLPKK